MRVLLQTVGTKRVTGYNISENNLIYHNLTGAPGDLSEGVTDSTTWKVYLLNSSRQRVDSTLS